MSYPQLSRQQLSREQTNERWKRCQEARVAAGPDPVAGHEAALKVWNSWAEPLLARRGQLEAESKWELRKRSIGGRDRDAWIAEHIPEVQAWLWEARADFSGETLATSGDLERLDFSGFLFPGEALFVGTVFSNETWFEGAKFHGDAWFGESAFGGSCSFGEHGEHGVTEFFRDAWFGGAKFGSEGFKVEYTVFNNVRFHGPARFRPTLFNKVVWFEDAEFRALAWFPQSNFRDYTSFAGTRFRGDAVFGAMRSERSFDMAGTTFDHLPDFVEAHFTESPRLDNARFPRVGFWRSIFRLERPAGWARKEAKENDNAYRGWLKNTSLSARYRYLRKLAEEGKDHDRELRFFADEFRSRRWKEDKPWQPAFLFGLLYDLFSKFGRSVWRPLFWWCATTLAFAVYYLSQHMALAKQPYATGAVAWSWHAVGAWLTGLLPGLGWASRPASALSCLPTGGGNSLMDAGSNPLWSAFYLAVKKSFIVSIDQSEKVTQAYACLYGIYGKASSYGGLAEQQLIPVIPDTVIFAGVGQSVLSAALVFLLLLALRNQFKIR